MPLVPTHTLPWGGQVGRQAGDTKVGRSAYSEEHAATVLTFVHLPTTVDVDALEQVAEEHTQATPLSGTVHSGSADRWVGRWAQCALPHGACDGVRCALREHRLLLCA